MKPLATIGRLTHGITQFSLKPTLVAALAAIVAVSLYSVSSPMEVVDVANLKVARLGHTATELADGRVPIVGGQNETGTVSDSEIFDPGTKTFSLAPQLRQARTEHTATLLADGRVLVTGGRANDVLLDSTEIFDPLSNSFSYGPKMNHERVGHTATALSDGSLLVAGGDEAASAERFNPESKKFELLEARLSGARSFHSAAVLRSGKVLIAGGLDRDGKEQVTAELFDLETRSFSPTASSMHIERVRPALVVLARRQSPGHRRRPRTNDGDVQSGAGIFHRLRPYSELLGPSFHDPGRANARRPIAPA